MSRKTAGPCPHRFSAAKRSQYSRSQSAIPGGGSNRPLPARRATAPRPSRARRPGLRGGSSRSRRCRARQRRTRFAPCSCRPSRVEELRRAIDRRSVSPRVHQGAQQESAPCLPTLAETTDALFRAQAVDDGGCGLGVSRPNRVPENAGDHVLDEGPVPRLFRLPQKGRVVVSGSAGAFPTLARARPHRAPWPSARGAVVRLPPRRRLRRPRGRWYAWRLGPRSRRPGSASPSSSASVR